MAVSPSSKGAFLSFLGIWMFSLVSAFADEDVLTKENNVIVLPAGQVYNGNYFAMGSSVEISGTVNGDVYVLAEQAVIDGVVNGDVLGCVGSMDISGKVNQNCRIAAGQILISGQIGRNVTALAGNLQLLSSALVGGGLVATAGNVDVAANIGSDATIIASNFRLSSHIKNNLQAYVGQMRITSRSVIGGNVDYRSSSEAWIDPGATIAGQVIYHPSFVHKYVQGTWIRGLLIGSKVLATLMNFIYTLAVGFILIKLFHKNLEAALQAIKWHPLKSLGIGIILLILLPLAAFILLMTILGAPFALTLMAANIIGFYTAKVYSIFWVSNWLFGKVGFKHNRMPAFFCGTILYFCLTAIPVFGMLMAFVAMLLGLGGGVLAQTKRGIFTTPSST